jgi:hypothetical protein
MTPNCPGEGKSVYAAKTGAIGGGHTNAFFIGDLRWMKRKKTRRSLMKK